MRRTSKTLLAAGAILAGLAGPASAEPSPVLVSGQSVAVPIPLVRPSGAPPVPMPHVWPHGSPPVPIPHAFADRWPVSVAPPGLLHHLGGTTLVR